MSVPIKSPKVLEDSLPSVIVWYGLEANWIVHLDQMKYVLLSHKEQETL